MAADETARQAALSKLERIYGYPLNTNGGFDVGFDAGAAWQREQDQKTIRTLQKRLAEQPLTDDDLLAYVLCPDHGKELLALRAALEKCVVALERWGIKYDGNYPLDFRQQATDRPNGVAC